MGNGFVLFFSLGVISLIALGIHYFLWKARKKDKEMIDKDWIRFKSAVAKNNISEINSYGKRLVWNKYLNKVQLVEMIDTIDERVKKYPELKELSLDLFNKKLDYESILPYPGSSGGIKQSW